MTEKWLTNIAGDKTDCTPGMCAACCVWPQIETAGFYKPAYTPCPDLDQSTLLCNSWPDPACGKKAWTCRENVNHYQDAHVFRGELLSQRLENIRRKYALLKLKKKMYV